MIPPAIWCFITKEGKISGTTDSKDAANGWMPHLRVGESVAEYALVKAETKRKGNK